MVDEPGEGIPLGVKDLFDTAGLTTTYGSAIFRDHVPDRTAEAVRRLEATGYANVGKTNLHEFAYGVTSENPHFGDVLNPLDSDRVAGGSSGGSAAAVAAGLCEVALGTDTGGSIRIPAACCGITGFKPTHGLVPTDGVFPLAPSFDHVGPLTRTVGECVSTLEVLVSGFQPVQLESLDEISVGVAWLDDAEAQVRKQVGAAVELFPRRRDVQLPRRVTPTPSSCGRWRTFIGIASPSTPIFTGTTCVQRSSSASRSPTPILSRAAQLVPASAACSRMRSRVSISSSRRRFRHSRLPGEEAGEGISMSARR